MFRFGMIISAALLLISCGSTPLPPAPGGNSSAGIARPNMTPIPKGVLTLPDRAAFQQKDKRWGHERLGNSSDTMASDGCLVTAASMALANLGFATNPSDLNARLTKADSFTPRGWLIWDGIRKVTDGRAQAHFYDDVSEDIINSCLIKGHYPLVQFYLPNGRSHWAMILSRTQQGYFMRDPLRDYKSPLLFPRSSEAFKAVRCIGIKA